VIGRAALLAAMVLAAGAYGGRAGALEHPVDRVPLRNLPCGVGEWRCAGDTPLDRDSLAILRVDDYVNRTYVDPSGRALSVYIGYYASQRQGGTTHSPLNCLPGSGWQPTASDRISVAAPGLTFDANRIVVQRALERQVVLYWYQGRGRVVAGEYANKFWLMADSMRQHRSDGALVRIVAPAMSADAAGLASATAAAEQFARMIQPRLSPYLP